MHACVGFAHIHVEACMCISYIVYHQKKYDIVCDMFNFPYNMTRIT